MEHLIYRFFCFLGIHLPDWLACFTANVIAELKYYLAPGLRRIITENLRQVLIYRLQIENIPFDEKTLRTCVKRAYRNFGAYMVEFFQIPKWNEKLVREKVRVVNIHYLDRALSKSKGAVVITAHLGNWELAGIATSLLGYNLSAVALPFKNDKIASIFIRRRRSKGVNVILTGANPKEYLRALKQNNVIAILGDRLFTEKGICVRFLGRDTYLPRGPATLAARWNSAFLAGFLVREKKGRYALIFDEPMEAPYASDQQQKIISLVEQGARYLEKYILKYPAQWLNFSPMWNMKKEVDDVKG